VLFSRIFYIPGYLGKMGMIEPLQEGTVKTLKLIGDGVLALALILGAVTVLTALIGGIREHRRQHAPLAEADGYAD